MKKHIIRFSLFGGIILFLGVLVGGVWYVATQPRITDDGAVSNTQFVTKKACDEPWESHVTTMKTVSAKFMNESWTFALADTSLLQTRGLSCSRSLPEKTGMIFDFQKEDLYPFWMKNMNYSIDMIWVSDKGCVVEMYENATPESYPAETQGGNKKARAVIEINAGEIKRLKIGIGSCDILLSE